MITKSLALSALLIVSTVLNATGDGMELRIINKNTGRLENVESITLSNPASRHGIGEKFWFIAAGLLGSKVSADAVKAFLKKNPKLVPLVLLASGLLINYSYPFTMTDSLVKDTLRVTLGTANVVAFIQSILYLMNNGLEDYSDLLNFSDEQEVEKPMIATHGRINVAKKK